MNLNPDVIDMIGKFVAVNAVATLLLAVLSVLWSKLALNAVAALDRWLDPTRRVGDEAPDRNEQESLPPIPAP